MVLLSRLENYAKQNRLFSNLKFGFQEGVGCTEASFAILELINRMLERGSKGTLKSEVKYCTPPHCPENLTFHKELIGKNGSPIHA